jgi:hypothetical protein
VRKFLPQLILVAIVSGVGYYLLGYLLPEKWFFNSYVWIDILFILVTYSFHLGLKRSHLKGGKNFIRYYMGATGLKLFFFLMLIIVYALLNKEEAVAYALCFFFFYFIFTAFEVRYAFNQFGRKPQELAVDKA